MWIIDVLHMFTPEDFSSLIIERGPKVDSKPYNVDTITEQGAGSGADTIIENGL
jgi:hypothetical protein